MHARGYVAGFPVFVAAGAHSPIASPPRAPRLQLEALEIRLNPSTYYWTALGDGLNWNDPTNWAHFVPYQSMAQTGVPTAYSDVVFPPIATLPKGAATTINFNFSYLVSAAQLAVDQ